MLGRRFWSGVLKVLAACTQCVAVTTGTKSRQHTIARTIMLNGEPWLPAREMPTPSTRPQPRLASARVAELITLFKAGSWREKTVAAFTAAFGEPRAFTGSDDRKDGFIDRRRIVMLGSASFPEYFNSEMWYALKCFKSLAKRVDSVVWEVKVWYDIDAIEVALYRGE